MTAGRGIVHSERTPAAERASGHGLHGIQVWVALPLDAEEVEPSFNHHAAGALPRIDIDGVAMRLVVGTAFGQRSPVLTFSDMFYLGAEFASGTTLRLPPEHAERAVYAADASLTIDGTGLEAGQLAVLAAGAEVEIHAAQAARAVLFGGAPLDGDRHLWWNFVSSTRERIERAKADWVAERFGKVPGETAFIPLPER
jgi:redox-sensitive bicupin YhaK (pirin superfamily)